MRGRSSWRYYVTKDGKGLHRSRGPAAERPDGSKHWWREKNRHRVGGPAVEGLGFRREWWLEGDRHRDGGLPAFVSDAGDLFQWWVHGEMVAQCMRSPDGCWTWMDSHGKVIRVIYKLKIPLCWLDDKADSDAMIVTDSDTRMWHRPERAMILHRIEGPAIEASDGFKAWHVGEYRRAESVGGQVKFEDEQS